MEGFGVFTQFTTDGRWREKGVGLSLVPDDGEQGGAFIEAGRADA